MGCTRQTAEVGKKILSWTKYHGKRGQNQGFSSIICVDEDLRFFPRLCLLIHGSTFPVRLLWEPHRGTRRIACPVLVLWGRRGQLESAYDVLAVWRDWTDDVRGRALDCGHYLPEEAPDETYAELYRFFDGPTPSA
jgi:pimeloyl-ACP methyl ester carboxylesterase